MSLLPEQQDIARLLFGLPEAADYALAGGSALIVHGTINRPTRDLDAFVQAEPDAPHGDVRPLAEALVVALTANGWTTTVIHDHQTFMRLSAAKTTSVEIDLAIDSPRLFPTTTIDGIPMLAEQDLAARKVLAIVDRAEGRDYTDLEALQQQLARHDCIRWAQQLDNGLTPTAIADAFGHIGRLDDTELPTDNPTATRQLFAEWATDLHNTGT